MMTDEQKAKVADLKEALVASASAPSGAPDEVREAVVALKKQMRAEGTTARTLAAALDVHESTLCRWEREVRSAPRSKPGTSTRVASPRGRRGRVSSFRAVQIVSPEASATRSAPSPLSYGLRVVHAPSGLVVEGLDVETLASLLRRMS